MYDNNDSFFPFAFVDKQEHNNFASSSFYFTLTFFLNRAVFSLPQEDETIVILTAPRHFEKEIVCHVPHL